MSGKERGGKSKTSCSTIFLEVVVGQLRPLASVPVPSWHVSSYNLQAGETLSRVSPRWIRHCEVAKDVPFTNVGNLVGSMATSVVVGVLPPGIVSVPAFCAVERSKISPTTLPPVPLKVKFFVIGAGVIGFPLTVPPLVVPLGVQLVYR